MWEDAFETDTTKDWSTVALRGGAATLRVPADWMRLSRDDGGLAYQSPGDNPVDLLISLTTYRNPYGVRPDEAIQYLDRENVLPHGIAPSEDDGDRRWLAYAVAQPPNRQVFVWKVADFSPPDHVRVVTVQLHVPDSDAPNPDLGDLVDRLGEEAARIEFSGLPVKEPVERVTMRNVGHGDLVRFRLPWDWQSDLDGDLAVFYRPEPGTGTLRVAVHSFPHAGDGESGDGDPGGADGAAAEAAARIILRQTAEQFADGPDGRVGEGSVEWLPDDEVMARFATGGEEDGEPVRFHLWLRGNVVDGQTTLALFSFVMAEELHGGPQARATLAMLEAEIRAAVVGVHAQEA